MINQEIAKIFREVAACYSIKDEKKHYFQIVAYQRAAEALEHSTQEIKDLWQEGKLKEFPGIGPSIAQYLEELLKTGSVSHFEEVKKGIPESVFPLLSLPKIGPKTAYKLVTTLKLTNPHNVISDLEKAAIEGKIAPLPTFGEKSQEEILQGIKEFHLGKTKTSRMVLPFAFEINQRVIDYLKECQAVIKIEPLGSLRRMAETVGDIDIAVASKKPQEVLDWFVKYPKLERILEVGDTTASFLTSGQRQVDLMIQPPEAFGSLLQHFTGSKAHNIHLRTYAQEKGLSLSEYGIKSSKQLTKNKKQYNAKLGLYQFDDEKKFYEAIGLEWIPPEMREDTGEIELAIKHQLPNLINYDDLKGDLHIHSSFDLEPSHDLGTNSIWEMAKKAQKLGYEYLGFSEHNPSITKHNSSEIYDLIYQRNKEIEQIKSSSRVKLLKLLEVDILSNGKLAIDDKSLSLLDGVIVSVHSSFTQDEETMTKRILTGLSHPKARILGHPTGRLLNERKPVEANWQKIFEYCAKNNKAIEINAWPTRLDLPDVLIRKALKIGVKFVIGTDSHAMEQMEVIKFGIAMARRGWAKKSDILNTLSYNEFIKWLRKENL